MTIADLFVLGVVATFLGFVVWVNVHHRKKKVARKDRTREGSRFDAPVTSVNRAA
ncbi:hypothetical protein [Aureimonas sp. SK2]|uniref:hypothetical protein n=1 Tax=Aureimonas sp. SK2 TaxID=3015992 RepID=UPI002443ED47|nr:hypothetical protein [Aureimonas sp. SK2]